MNERALQRVQMEALRRALEREEFRLFYQPKADLVTGKICGFEALLRWQHPDKGMILPGDFIPVLEETGLIVQAGEWFCARPASRSRPGRKRPEGASGLGQPVGTPVRAEEPERRRRADPGVIRKSILPYRFEITSLLMTDPEERRARCTT